MSRLCRVHAKQRARRCGEFGPVVAAREQVAIAVERHDDRGMPEPEPAPPWPAARGRRAPCGLMHHEAKKWRKACSAYFGSAVSCPRRRRRASPGRRLRSMFLWCSIAPVAGREHQSAVTLRAGQLPFLQGERAVRRERDRRARWTVVFGAADLVVAVGALAHMQLARLSDQHRPTAGRAARRRAGRSRPPSAATRAACLVAGLDQPLDLGGRRDVAAHFKLALVALLLPTDTSVATCATGRP